MIDKKKILKETFGLDSFRDKQEEAIESLMNNQNTLCLMPTGMGKSLIYQFSAHLKGKMAIVFSPLLALMSQQNSNLNLKLNKFNKKSFAFNSEISTKKQYNYLRNDFAPPNDPAFLFLSPEKVMTDGYLEFVLRKYKDQIGLIVIDEAHCVSQWGNSFRPSYKMLPELFNNIFGSSIPTTLCLTATISSKDKVEIETVFNIANTIISDSLFRHNIALNVLPEYKKNPEKREKLKSIIDQYPNEKIIVYTHIKKREYGTREMSDYFNSKGYKCAPFDSDLDSKTKDNTLKEFMNGGINIIFATNAFGMGIDIPDIRCVVHYLIPESLEQYYQEVGRAGRNGEPSYAYLLHAEPNVRIKRDLINKEKITSDIINDEWIKLLGRKGENDLPYIGQFNTFEDKNILGFKVFLSLVQMGVIRIISKGISKIKCFEDINEVTSFSNYNNISRTGSTKLISKKLNKPIITISENIYELYHSNKLKLVSSPSKVLFYQVNRKLEQKEIDKMIFDFKDILNYKIKSLSYLEEVLNRELTMEEALSKYLGINA